MQTASMNGERIGVIAEAGGQAFSAELQSFQEGE
jgi:hypothetical protein